MEMYQPGAIVMCCGADSLSGDRLGCFNLSLEGHSNCLEFLARFNVPMLILGGGGYTLRNVARCWCYETGRMMGIDLPDVLPEKALDEYNMYLDTQRLRIAVSNMKNANERPELEQIKTAVLAYLSQLPPVPSAQMAYVPPAAGRDKPTDGLPEEDPDVRGGGQAHDEVRRVRDGDESDGEEGTGRGGFGEHTNLTAAAGAAVAGGRVFMRFTPDGQPEARPVDGQAAAGGDAMVVDGVGAARPAAVPAPAVAGPGPAAAVPVAVPEVAQPVVDGGAVPAAAVAAAMAAAVAAGAAPDLMTVRQTPELAQAAAGLPAGLQPVSEPPQ